jgi:hypothetical protein
MLPSPYNRCPPDSGRKSREVAREVFVSPEVVATVWAYRTEGELAERRRCEDAVVVDVVFSMTWAIGLLARREPVEMN